MLINQAKIKKDILEKLLANYCISYNRKFPKQRIEENDFDKLHELVLYIEPFVEIRDI